MYFGIWGGVVFWTPIYIFFRFNWTRLNGVEPDFYGHILSYWFLVRSIERIFGHSKKIERDELVQFWYNLDYFCTCQIGVIFGKKGLSSILFVPFREKKKVYMGRCSPLPCKVNLSNSIRGGLCKLEKCAEAQSRHIIKNWWMVVKVKIFPICARG